MQQNGVRLIKEVDDLDLIKCSACGGTGKPHMSGKHGRCPHCNGTGDRVVHRTKHYDRRQWATA